MASKTEPLPTISSAASPFRHHHPSPARLLTGLLASALAHTYSPQASCVRPSHSPAQNLPVALPAIRIKVKGSFCAIHSPSPFQPPPGPSACSLAPAPPAPWGLCRFLPQSIPPQILAWLTPAPVSPPPGAFLDHLALSHARSTHLQRMLCAFPVPLLSFSLSRRPAPRQQGLNSAPRAAPGTGYVFREIFGE